MKNETNRVRRTTLLTSLCMALCGALGAGASGSAAAQAQPAEWAPTKPVRIVVPIVGGTNDVLARLVAPKLQEVFGQTFIVDNKGGAGGNIGAAEVARAAPDGHTLLVGFNGPIAINKTLFKNLPYDPVTDFAPITLAVTSPQFLTLNRNVPASDMKEFLALARSRKLSYASVSVGSASHLTMEMFKSAAGVDLTHIPYKGSAPAVVDLVGGVVDASFLVPGNILQFVQEGKAKVIAVSGEKRFASMPQVPTMIELGYPDFVALSWIGFLAPGKTPQPIVDRYNKEIVRILQMPDIKEQLKKMEFDVVATSPKQFGQWIATEIERWGKVVKATGATSD